jgi:hypothetical protein
VSFRVRPELATAILHAAVDQGVSVQTFILLALRAAGISVLDADLDDLRVGAPGRQHYRGGATPGARAANVLRNPASLAGLPSTADLESFLTRIMEFIARSAIAAPANITISNCCRSHPAASDETSRSAKTKNRS